MSDQNHWEEKTAQLERRLKRLEYSQRILDSHISALERNVAAIERSVVLRAVARVGRVLAALKARTVERLPGSPHRSLSPHVQREADSYASWVESSPAGTPPPPAGSPRFAILLAVTNPRREWLEEAVASVTSQSYPRWELWICHEAAAEGWLAEYLDGLSRSDNRIHASGSSEQLGVVAALNRSGEAAKSEYIALLDGEGKLASDALLWLSTGAPATVIYGDEDFLDDTGRRRDPVFKPDWSPDLLLSCMYVGEPTAVSRDAWERAGRYRPEFNGEVNYDLLLRVTDQPVVVRHVPRVLYHRRMDARPTTECSAGGGATQTVRKNILESTISRRGMEGVVENGDGEGIHRIRWAADRRALASLIICSRTPRLLNRCLRAISARTEYPKREVIVVQHLGQHDAAVSAVIEACRARSMPYSGQFNFSRMNNLGARIAAGEVLVFLNDDVEPIEASWLERLIGQLQRPDVGVAGARLLYPSGALQHAGVTIGISDGCGHIGRGSQAAPYWPWLTMTRDVAAVTGACLAIRTDLFRQLGGFSEAFPVNYNDIDLCLRAREAGYRVILDSAAVLRHYECQTRTAGVTLRERELWYDRWGDLIDAGDPFYSPHLTREREDLSLRTEPGP